MLETTTSTGLTLTRGEALRAFIAAIVEVAKVNATFTTDDVFARASTNVCGPNELRALTAPSKLVSVALAKARKLGHCVPTNTVKNTGDDISKSRPKRVWRSLHVQADSRDLTLV